MKTVNESKKNLIFWDTSGTLNNNSEDSNLWERTINDELTRISVFEIAKDTRITFSRMIIKGFPQIGFGILIKEDLKYIYTYATNMGISEQYIMDMLLDICKVHNITAPSLLSNLCLLLYSKYEKLTCWEVDLINKLTLLNKNLKLSLDILKESKNWTTSLYILDNINSSNCFNTQTFMNLLETTKEVESTILQKRVPQTIYKYKS